MDTTADIRPPRRGPKLSDLRLTDEERTTLERWAGRPTSSQALADRCRIVLACASGASNSQVARELGVARPTVIKWRSRFVARRLEGLVDEPRPGAPRKLTDEHIEQVIITTLETTPQRRHPLVDRSLGPGVGMNQTAVSRIWGRLWLTPHCRGVQALDDPQVIDKVRDIVGLYLTPPRPPWSCVWMKRPSAGAGPDRAGAAPAARHAAAAQPRLPPPRHHQLYAALDVSSAESSVT